MQFLNKYKKWNPHLVINTNNIWDFALSLNNNHVIEKNSDKKIASIFFDNIDSNNLNCDPNSFWGDSICENAIFKNIGFTGIDNGFIAFNKNTITNKGFEDILTNSVKEFKTKTLVFNPIYSNTKTYSLNYEYNKDEKCVSLKGGFFQTPFKINNNYQVLPTNFNNIKINMVIKPGNYEIEKNALNNIHPQNSGILFFVGTRAENKFLIDYGYDFSNYKIRDGYKEICENASFYDGNEEFVIDDYFLNNYFSLKNEMQNKYFPNDFIEDEAPIDENNLTLNNNVNVKTEGYFEIKTNNKYLFFNNTKEGYNTETWSDNIDIVLTGSTKKNTNMFLLLNNTKTGYTVNNIIEHINENEKGDVTNKIKNDIVENAFAIRINDNNAIGYRYIVSDCSSENGFKIIEEYGYPNAVTYNEWNNITIKFSEVLGNKMRIYIYVNNLLKFISKELPQLNLRKLNEINEKQEGVPFNISIGGGTLGLCDCISWNYNTPFKYVLPLEENFAGTFIGDIKSFSIYK